MGLIPLFIALLAFVLLLILVNVNSIQTRQQSLGLAFFMVCQTAKSRNALIRRLQMANNDLSCPMLPANNRLKPRQIPAAIQFVSQERHSLKEAEDYLQKVKPSAETIRYMQSLQVLNQRQRINLRTFERKVREYNLMIKEYPTAMVALLYRLKPIRLSAYRK